MAKFCTNCGQEVDGRRNKCPNCGQGIKNSKVINNSTDNINASYQKKSRLLSGIIAIIFGYLGVHNLYLGYSSKGVAQLLITLLSFGHLSFISAIWGVIDGIMILSGSIDKDGYGNPLGK